MWKSVYFVRSFIAPPQSLLTEFDKLTSRLCKCSRDVLSSINGAVNVRLEGKAQLGMVLTSLLDLKSF